MANALISLQDIRKTYVLGDQTVHALKKIDLDIHQGEYVALMGPSGSVRNDEIGFVFQTFNLLNRLSSLENVALPLVYAGISQKERLERARETLNKVGLGNRLDHKPNELSGGQRQRVAVARALINNPSLLLADEPTGNLDTQTSHEIMGLFEEIHAGGNTIVLVTHEEDIAKHAKKIVRLRDGLIAS